LRFLIPYLCNYKGWALFTDDDFLWLSDIAELLQYMDDSKAVLCVQHKTKSTATVKLAGVKQENYPRKNWSSVMLFNCAHADCANLTLPIVNSRGGAYLHRMNWAEDKNIGELPYVFNWLVDWYDTKKHKRAKVVHYTDGGPYYPDYRERGVDYAQEWFQWLKKYEAQLPGQRLLTPYERFSTAKPPSKPLPGYANSNDYPWTWDMDDEWQKEVKKMLKDEISEAGKLAKKIESLQAELRSKSTLKAPLPLAKKSASKKRPAAAAAKAAPKRAKK